MNTAIDAAEIGASSSSLQARLRAVVHLIRTAAEEYEIGVQNGNVVNSHEYQDALGFVRVARIIVEALASETDDDTRDAIEEIVAQLQHIEPAWPSVVAPSTVNVDASLIYLAAARIEIAALSVK